MDMDKDFDYCKNIIKSSSKSFYRAFSILPKDKAKAIYAIYAFCRLCDDLIDVDKNYIKLMKLKEELKLFSEGKIGDSPIWRCLNWVFNKYDMDILPFFQMVNGQEKDANFSGIKTQKELLDYCYDVAGTVGLMILPVLATDKHRELEASAVKLGEAMQITNILRDIGEDLKIGRVYIPEDIMNNFNYSREKLEKGIIDKSFIDLWEYEALIAEELYKEVFKDIHKFDRDSIPSVLIASSLYKEILNSVRKSKYDCINLRNYVSSRKKLSLIIKNSLGIKLGIAY